MGSCRVCDAATPEQEGEFRPTLIIVALNMGALPIFMVKTAGYRRPTFEVPAAHDKSSGGGEARLFSKSRHLRGLKRGSGNSDGKYPERTSPMSATSVLSPDAAANDAAEPTVGKSSRSWPFAYALGLGLAASAVLWAAIAAAVHYL
jgi:hypothetical protein